jgi:3-oxoacyl-[acyl-carrier-protein] synthase-3
MNIKITGSGSYLPEIIVSNLDFSNHHFMNEDGTPFAYSNETVIGKFKGITGIEERRYADSSIITSDMAYLASDKAIKNAGIDPESLDYIIVAHNFGDIKSGTIQSDALPCLAARVKNKLQIQNPKCVAFDILFGCPGWIEGMLQAYALIKSGMAQKCLVIGAEALSRVVDPHDRDSMIYADGAGATIVETTDENCGILSHESASYTLSLIHI